MKRAGCIVAGCRRPAPWVPVLVAPIGAASRGARAGAEVFAVELGIRTCSEHRLPRQGWAGLSDPGVQEAFRRLAGPLQVQLEDAHIEHLWRGGPDGGHDRRS